MKNNKQPLVSIVIPTHNSERTIVNCLVSIQNQDYENYEIICVDNLSDDDTINILRQFRKVRLSFQDEMKSAGKTRNLGAEKSNGEFLLFIDSDEIIGNRFIKKMLIPILKEEAEATVPYHDNNGKIEYFGKNIMRCIRKDLFIKIGKFNYNKGYADDILDTKISIKRVDVPLNHLLNDSLRNKFEKGEWIGESFRYTRRSGLFSWLFQKIGIISGAASNGAGVSNGTI